MLLALLPSPAHAQDATVLAVLLVPPIVCAPLVVTLGRRAWLSRRGLSPPGFLVMFGLACLEVVLWMFAASLLAVVFFDERWHLQALVALAVALLADWGAARYLLQSTPGARPPRWVTLLLASAIPFGLAALGALTTAVLIIS